MDKDSLLTNFTDINADGKVSWASEYNVVVFDLCTFSVQVKVSAD